MTFRLTFGVWLFASAAAVGAGSVEVDPPEVAIGGVAVIRVARPGASGTFDRKPLRFFERGNVSVALLGIDLDHRPGRFPLRISAPGGVDERRELRVHPKEFPVERLTVPKGYTDLDPKTLARVRREQRRLAVVWTKSHGERYWEGAFAKPADGPAGSPFGLRRFFNGEPRSPHTGIDFKSPTGAPVRAANRGAVALVDDFFFTGRTIVLDHGLGLYTLYIHLSEAGVQPGEVVERGQQIGKVGATGRVTGPHLHFAARLGDARVDPAALLGRVVD